MGGFQLRIRIISIMELGKNISVPCSGCDLIPCKLLIHLGLPSSKFLKTEAGVWVSEKKLISCHWRNQVRRECHSNVTNWAEWCIM